MSNVTQLYVLHKSRSLMRPDTSLVQLLADHHRYLVSGGRVDCIHLTYNKTSEVFHRV